MYRFEQASGLALVMALLAVSTAGAQSVSVDTPDGEPVERCDQLKISFDEQPAARGEQQLAVARGDAPTLTVDAPQHGGVYAVGSERADYSVTACTAWPQGGGAVPAIEVAARGEAVVTSGPAHGRWLVYLIIKAPRDAGLVLQATNGPISVREMAGTVTARTTNGPIGVKGCTGKLEARAQNGPIGFEGSGGEVSLNTQNGPIAVRLGGTEWQRGSLEAHAQNGPIAVRVAEGYRSGVRVESSNHSPWSCKGAACSAGRKNWDDSTRWVELGTGPTVVRISTQNGPVAIGDSSGKDWD
jgi:hypothetical protein